MPVAWPTSALQSVTQPPHFATFADVDVSQPVFAVGLWQWLKPVAQIHLHDPAAHERLAALVLEQIVPHAPQLSGSVSGVLQTPAQQSGLGPPHALPHPLQLNTSAVTSMQRPPQHCLPPLHDPPGQVETH